MLAYGQTGSGKTYTMGTSKITDTDEQTLGIIPRVIEHLFSLMKERSPEFQYTTKVSFLEVSIAVLLHSLHDEPSSDWLIQSLYFHQSMNVCRYTMKN